MKMKQNRNQTQNKHREMRIKQNINTFYILGRYYQNTRFSSPLHPSGLDRKPSGPQIVVLIPQRTTK